ncbi:hypothetical protein N7447_007837 [Penicillium robsamsonii]|uniref:uncharacterized protein n=1 Tax=Penicillium robsamsonii TaxID=1792511 RepID=UPI002548D41C|nr:uncharacterized protein N7447_007837 [Penicillium robsamsonii]KAJ5817829.1 hypothetical protein N7447_007837 [Penicillium robsamsonii]
MPSMKQIIRPQGAQLNRGSAGVFLLVTYHTMTKSSIGNLFDESTFLRLHRSERIQKQVSKSHKYPQVCHV